MDQNDFKTTSREGKNTQFNRASNVKPQVVEPDQGEPDEVKQDPLWHLIADVGNGIYPLQHATTQLRDYVKSLTPEGLENWKANAAPTARRVMAIAEAFNQELTVIAAGQ